MVKRKMREKITRIVRKAVGVKAAFDVTVPENEAFGHYATNAALRMTKTKRRDPMRLGHELVLKIQRAAPKGFFEKIEVAAPGFINFWISREALTANVADILKQKSRYGSSRLGRGKKIQVEFVSANPTGPLTLANGRGGFLGDVISNTLEYSGFTVEREYYVNDTGNQIITLGKSILALAKLAPWQDHFYKGDYLKKWTRTHRTQVKKHASNPLALGQLAAKDFLADIRRVLGAKAGIRFNRFTSEEGHVYKKGLAKEALALFERKKLAYEKDAAVWLKTTAFGDDKDRVLVTRDGFPTYFLADAGHYLETKKRGFDAKLNILGPDHYGYVRRIQAAAKIVGVKNSEIIITQTVRLVRKGKEVKMSKRKGEFITFEKLLKEVRVDAARFFFLMVAPETHMDFDLALAKERSLKNPVYYLQYAAVRCQGILKKTNRKQQNATKAELAAFLNTSEDARLMKELARFPEVVAQTAKNYRVHQLTAYASELAAVFHRFYEKERVAGQDAPLLRARRTFVHASFTVFENLLRLMGLKTRKKM